MPFISVRNIFLVTVGLNTLFLFSCGVGGAGKVVLSSAGSGSVQSPSPSPTPAPGPAQGVSDTVVLGGNSASTDTTIGLNTSHDLSLVTAGVPRLTITSSGSVGVGTLTPIYKFNVSETRSDVAVSSASATVTSSFVQTLDPASNSSTQFYATQNMSQSRSGNSANFFKFTGAANSSFHYGAGQVNSSVGSDNHSINFGTGTIISATGAVGYAQNMSSGVITNAAGLLSYVSNSGPGSITNGFGVYVGSVSGTNRWSIYTSDSSPSYFGGDIGVGTTAAAASVDIVKDVSVGTSAALRVKTIDLDEIAVGSKITLETRTLSNDEPSILEFVANQTVAPGNRLGVIDFRDNTQSYAKIQAGAGPNHISAANMDGILTFWTTSGVANSTEKMRIDKNGNVGIGLPNPGFKLDVNGDVNIASSGSLRFGGISVCTSSGCTASSDRNLKENIQPLRNSLDQILRLQGVEYDYKDKSKFTSQRQIGVIAQEVEKIYPQVVITDPKSGFKSVAYDHLVAPLIEAFKTIYQRLVVVENNQEICIREIAFLKTRADSQSVSEVEIEALQLQNEDLKRQNAIQAEKLNNLQLRLDKIEKLLNSK